LDQLTGLPTHKDLESRPDDFLRAAGSGILLDIDGFNWVNYQGGPGGGDAALVRLAQWLRRQAAELSGHVLRVAGDEFLVLLPGGSLPDARSIAESLVSECAALGIPYERPGDSRTALSMSAVAFRVEQDLADRLADVRDRAGARRYEREVAEGRNYGIVTDLE
jgi:diguanylate cyclase (GGDEF)-like protein